VNHSIELLAVFYPQVIISLYFVYFLQIHFSNADSQLIASALHIFSVTMPLLTTAFFSLVLISHVMPLTKSTCFLSRTNVTLHGHVILSYPTAGLNDCWQTCKNEMRCQSLNFFVKRQLCEINNRTIELAANNKSVETAFTSYFDNPYRGGYFFD